MLPGNIGQELSSDLLFCFPMQSHRDVNRVGTLMKKFLCGIRPMELGELPFPESPRLRNAHAIVPRWINASELIIRERTRAVYESAREKLSFNRAYAVSGTFQYAIVALL